MLLNDMMCAVARLRANRHPFGRHSIEHLGPVAWNRARMRVEHSRARRRATASDYWPSAVST